MTGSTKGTTAPATTGAPKTSAAVPSSVDTRTDAEREAEEAEAAAERDRQGATLVAADAEGDIAAGTTVLTPTDVPTLEGGEDDWAEVVVVADAPERLPAHKGAKVIMAERRTQPDDKGQGAGRFDTEAKYSKNADAYVGHYDVDEGGQPRDIFPEAGGPVFLIGQNVKQFGLGGVSRQNGFLSVGPGSSIVAAVNLALQKGAKRVTVSGMTDHDKAIVGPWLDKISGEFESLDYGQKA